MSELRAQQHDLDRFHQQQEDQLRGQQRQEERQATLEAVLQKHCSRMEEAMSAVNALVHQHSPHQDVDSGDAGAGARASVERRLNDISSQLVVHAARINRLEKTSQPASQDQDEGVATAVAELRESGTELSTLFRRQRSDLEELRQQFDELREKLSLRSPLDEHEPAAAKATMQSVELQLRELVSELRKLQQEQKMQQSRARENEKSASAEGAATILGDLREEKGQVADMLDGVKQEKLEVIAMMHSFAMDKKSALQELEDLRLSARGELGALREATYPAPVAATSSIHRNDSRQGDSKTHSMNARLFSAPAWLPTQISGQPSTTVAPIQPASVVTAPIVSAPAPVQLQSTSSARRQVGLATSPPAPGPRHTLSELRVSQRFGEAVDRTPVRRFVSAGLSPRFTDTVVSVSGPPAQDGRSVWVGR